MATEEIIKWGNLTLDANLEMLQSETPVAHMSLPSLDAIIGGIRESRLVVVSGEPGAGKTSFCDQLKTDVAEQGHIVLYVSYEIDESRLVAKSLSRFSGGRVKVSDYPRCSSNDCLSQGLDDAIRRYREVGGNIGCIDCQPTTVEISVEVGRILREKGVAPVLIVDYIQLIPAADTGRVADERTQINEAMSGLRRLATRYRVPIFAISSVNRASYDKESVGLGASAGSAGIEYGADAIIHLSVEGDKKERSRNLEKAVRPVIASVIKNRYGQTGSVALDFYTEYAAFVERSMG